MYELEIQKYLRSHPNLEIAIKDLETHHGIYTKAHSIHSHILNFNYNQIESKDGDPLVEECRSLILDSNNNWNVLARGYNRFYNYGQGSAAEINWQNSKVLMKLDGSYCALWFNPYEQKWNVATRGVPDATGEVNGYNKTFQELFWETFNHLGYTLPHHTNYTLLFELMRPENRVVCRYKDNRLVLHGIRDIGISDMPELNHDQIKAFGFLHGIEVVRAVTLSSIEEIIKSCESINPLDEEGYVVCDQLTFNRVKVKSPQYVALHSMRDGFGPKRVVQMIRMGDSQEWVTYFPEFKDLVDKYQSKYMSLCMKLTSVYQDIQHIKDQKEFALVACKYDFSGALFNLRAGKVNSIKEYFKNININNLVDYFG